MAAGKQHTVLLKSDGTAVAWGCNKYLQCNIPSLPEKVKYIQVAAGAYHTVLLRDDNRVVACGLDTDGRCKIPSYNDYIQVAAGTSHTVLLRKDGTVVACGNNGHGECVVPALENVMSSRPCWSRMAALTASQPSTSCTACWMKVAPVSLAI